VDFDRCNHLKHARNITPPPTSCNIPKIYIPHTHCVCGLGMIVITIHPDIHVWRYSPFCAPASLKRRFHSHLFPARLLWLRVPRICNACVWMTISDTARGFATDLVLWNQPLRNVSGLIAKLRNRLLPSPCLSVRPSVHKEQHGSHWTDFH
jgi:hypothetical protein